MAVHAAGLRRALVAAEVLPASAASGPAGRASRLLTKEAWLRSEVSGYWHPAVEVGEVGDRRQRAGRGPATPSGRSCRAISAPIGGVVLFLVTSLAMNDGDPLLAIGAE